MIIAITTNDDKNVGEFNSGKILLIDTDKNSKTEERYMNAVKYADILVTSHLDGFDAENITKSGVHPVKFSGTIEEAIEIFKDCGLKRTMPIGKSEGCGGSCGI
jgi:hypothetical protein